MERHLQNNWWIKTNFLWHFKPPLNKAFPSYPWLAPGLLQWSVHERKVLPGSLYPQRGIDSALPLFSWVKWLCKWFIHKSMHKPLDYSRLLKHFRLFIMFLSAVATQRVHLISSGKETWKQNKVTFPCSLATSGVIECLHIVDTSDGELPQKAPYIQPPEGPVMALSSWTDCLLCSNLSKFQWTLAFTEPQNGMPNFESFYTMNSKSRTKNLFHFLWQIILYMAANEKLCLPFSKQNPEII